MADPIVREECKASSIDSATADGPHAIDSVITGRYANRFFLDTPVRQETLHRILDVARFAPSGANIQPWRVYVLSGGPRRRLAHDIVSAFDDEDGDYCSEYDYYPAEFPEPFRSRRDAFGAAYYGALGIDREDRAARRRQTARNFEFFGAPVGLIFTIDRRLEIGNWLDYGAFLQNVMIAAKARGLDTCPQETFAKYHRVIRRHLPIDRQEIVICGMSLGYADREAAGTRGVQARAPVGSFAQFFGFDGDGADDPPVNGTEGD